MCQSLLKEILEEIKLQDFEVEFTTDYCDREKDNYVGGLYKGQKKVYRKIYKYIRKMLEEEKEKEIK